jgi:CRP-like cAMP-binding protein
MHGASFWRLLGDREREAITAAAKSWVFPAGAVLCMEGEPSTHVFILLSGWIKVISVTSEGREILEALCGEGDVVGEIAGQVTGYRTATVRAIGTVQTLIIGAEQFGELLDAYSGAAHAHRRATAEHQRAAYESHRNQILSSGSRRLACLLLDLAEQDGELSGSALTTVLPLSQEELASLIGASRSTVTRALSNWRSRHMIRTHQRHITILDLTKLRRVAGRSPGE